MRKQKQSGRASRRPGRKTGTEASRFRVAPGTGFPIVGIGASAGGLEALEEFFSHVPPNIGMAFVVVTHQHPGHVSLLPELLRKHTRMPVSKARDGQRVKPNCVYLSNAEQYLGILNGALQQVQFTQESKPPLPIDHFFISLAEDQRQRAIGLVLSGTATDGSLGLKAVKEAGGTTMAQEPESAKYAGMPRSAINTGAVDIVLPPEQLAERLAASHRKAMLPGGEPGWTGERHLPERLQKIVFLLRRQTGHDFSCYKPSTISRRMERRMDQHQIKGIQQYLQHVQENPHEADLLFKELLIGVTSFFRDPEAFASLSRKLLPKLLASKPEGSVLRAWTAGCSTGEEAYTIAILLQHCAERLKRRIGIQVFATDLDAQAIAAARTGLYPSDIAGDVPRHLLARYFTREAKKYRLKKSIRELVVFAPQNIIKDPPFTKLDLITCRNLLIYLNSDAQKQLLALFHYALKPEGLLLLGPSESIGDFNRHFSVVDKKWRIFSRKRTAPTVFPPMRLPIRPADSVERPMAAALSMDAGHEARAAALFEKLLANRFIPASVIVNAEGDISFIHGQTGAFLEPAPGQPRLNVMEMAREGLRLELGAALHRAATQEGEAVHQGVRVRANKGFAHVNLAVTQLKEPETVNGLFLVTFQPVSAPRVRKGRAGNPPTKRQAARLQEMERELRFTRESLRSAVEELQSSNEELQSTNEEMQSSNEELETSREEMQSLNEELQTVNTQLQTKVDALSETNDDMQNLLNSTSIATLFLDERLKIKRFTEQARGVVNLIPSDVGRPIGDLVSNLNYDQLEADAREVLRTLNSREREVQTKQGGWRLVRILPYRTMENVIEGLVVTFVDINRLKHAERAAEAARVFAEGIVASLREPVLVLDKDLRVVMANKSFYKFFQVSSGEVEQKLVYELGNGQWAVAKLHRLLGSILTLNRDFEDFEVTHDFPRIGRRVLLLNARRLKDEHNNGGLILLAMEDATEKPRHKHPKAVPQAGRRPRRTRAVSPESR